jgi:Zn-dependent peptidase ImmA (M78 family)/transcriptional regulator with XRE-family HTH domain
MAFHPSRLILARKRRGLTKAALARDSKLSDRILVKYESGVAEPSDETINLLASVLRFPPEFFFIGDVDEIVSDNASFRSLKKMTASQRYMAEAAGTLAVEFERWLDKRFNLPEPTLPSMRGIEPETAAEMLRVEWGVGQRPIDNMVHLAEAYGARVFSLPVDSATVDAFSVWQDKTPYIFLNPMKSGERGRMDVAHEVAHLVLHRHASPPNRIAEFEAERFASAFLMPKGDVLAHIPRAWSVKIIHKLKRRWKVSAMALVVRLWHLRVLTEWQYRSFCIELSETGFRKAEADGILREQSQLLTKVLESLREEGIARSSIARQLAITPSELNSLIAGLTISSVPHIGISNDQQRPDAPVVRPALSLVPPKP